MTEPRRRRRRKAARPAEILDAGLAEFAEKGFAATRLDDVAIRAGIAKGTIYLYFPSKEALFEAAIRDRLLGVIEGFSASTDGFEGTTEELLRRLLTLLYARVVGSDAAVLLKVMVAEGNRFPGLVTLYHDTVLSRGLTLIRAILARGIARGEVRDGPAARDPRLIVAPAIVAAIWTLVFAPASPLDRNAFLEGHLDLILNGLRPR
jgi:AcrR family transcriptional regulator